MKTIHGTRGNDKLTAPISIFPSTEGYEILGEEGDDIISGSHLADMLRGGIGADTLDGGNGNDTLDGGAGADLLMGGDGVDTATYESSGIGVTANLKTGRGTGGDAQGDIYRDIENLIGSNQADRLYGSLGDNVLIGGKGDDYIYGDDGRDQLDGGAGRDALDGGAGLDTARYNASGAGVVVNLATGIGSGGDAQGDTLKAIENVTGSAFGDTLIGDAGVNLLDGGAGNDMLEGGAGRDMLNGGTGIDTVSYASASVAVAVSLQEGWSIDDVSGDGQFNLADDVNGDGQFGEAEWVDTISAVENAIGSAHNDLITGTDDGNRLEGGGGADHLFGEGGNDTLVGGDGDDILADGYGDDLLDGGAGNDILGLSYGYADGASRGSGNDTMNGGDGADVLYGGYHDDLLEGGAGHDELHGGDGLDTISYANSNAGVGIFLDLGQGLGGHAQGDTWDEIENVTGSAHGDVLVGSAGANVIEGGDGDDVIRGGNGIDEIWGGAGNDTFWFAVSDQGGSSSGWNIEGIADFTAGGTDDVIDLTESGSGYDSLDDILANSQILQGLNGEAGLLIDLGPSGFVVLAGVTASSLTANDFIFM